MLIKTYKLLEVSISLQVFFELTVKFLQIYGLFKGHILRLFLDSKSLIEENTIHEIKTSVDVAEVFLMIEEILGKKPDLSSLEQKGNGYTLTDIDTNGIIRLFVILEESDNPSRLGMN
jgi:hypothetical protein